MACSTARFNSTFLFVYRIYILSPYVTPLNDPAWNENGLSMTALVYALMNAVTVGTNLGFSHSPLDALHESTASIWALRCVTQRYRTLLSLKPRRSGSLPVGTHTNLPTKTFSARERWETIRTGKKGGGIDFYGDLFSVSKNRSVALSVCNKQTKLFSLPPGALPFATK